MKDKRSEDWMTLDAIQPYLPIEHMISKLDALVREFHAAPSYDMALRIRDLAEALALRLNYDDVLDR